MKMLEALFLATVKAAPAATAAASAGDHWKWLVPVATLILGFGLKWLQDHVTEKDRRRHEGDLRREQRYDQLRMRRLDAERTNLLALQPMVLRLVRAGNAAKKEQDAMFRQGVGWLKIKFSPEIDQEVQLSALDLIPLESRIHTAEVANLLGDVVDRVWAMLSAPTKAESDRLFDEISQPHNRLHSVMGIAIKRLEDENQQLGDPSAR
ncbi:hypothetical protein [Stenotrophomonas indicatrix]|uniref:hypothetical protein n=1 Tax=Stenotrophomonas indicatrix TaxID=2045451 RepID=UPI002898EC87|nr:hypothetical protein [Stenotrophomonas indicatrix]